MTDPSYVYFVQVGDEGPIKIGFSDKPSRRLAQLQGSNWQTLHLIGVTPGDRFVERRIQERLERHALGREWFADVPEVRAEITEPVERVHDLLDAALAARDAIRRAITHLRDAEPDSGRKHLEAALSALTAVANEETPS